MDNPEEALSLIASGNPEDTVPMASGQLPWMVGMKHQHTGFQILFGESTVSTKHTIPKPEIPVEQV